MRTAKEISNAHRQTFGPWKRRDADSVSPALKGHRGICQGDSMQAVNDMGRLGFLTAKKFPAGWQIVEEVTNLNVRSRRNANFTNSSDLAPGNDYFRAGFGQSFPSRQTEPRDARNAGQGLASKTHRSHERKVRRAANLARRVTLET